MALLFLLVVIVNTLAIDLDETVKLDYFALSNKLLFGTAFPYRYTGSMLAVARSADISESDREKIFGLNLIKMLEEAGLR